MQQQRLLQKPSLETGENPHRRRFAEPSVREGCDDHAHHKRLIITHLCCAIKKQKKKVDGPPRQHDAAGADLLPPLAPVAPATSSFFTGACQRYGERGPLDLRGWAGPTALRIQRAKGSAQLRTSVPSGRPPNNQGKCPGSAPEHVQTPPSTRSAPADSSRGSANRLGECSGSAPEHVQFPLKHQRCSSGPLQGVRHPTRHSMQSLRSSPGVPQADRRIKCEVYKTATAYVP